LANLDRNVDLCHLGRRARRDRQPRLRSEGVQALSRPLAITLAFAAALAGGFSRSACALPAAATAGLPKNDYTDPATWLCRPGRQDACTVNLDATVIYPNGKMTKEVFHADPNPPIDCFYVYPTVSNDVGFNSTMAIEAEERSVALHQLARFGAKCRLFAPMYRQITWNGVLHAGDKLHDAGVNAYLDVLGAWNEYLEHDNHGRGVVLIGHSQGSGLLTPLIAMEIDGKPIQARIVSAILMGTSLQVPRGRDVGGEFKSMPLCHSASQIGCVIAFVSFRTDFPPSANNPYHFGQGQGDTVAACVNPAALGGGSGELKSYLSAAGYPFEGVPGSQAWTNPPRKIDTVFVRTPGLLTAECVANDHGSYLAVTIHPTPGSERANDIDGDVIDGGQVDRTWGLHLIDAHLTIGNLLDIVGEESRTYRARK